MIRGLYTAASGMMTMLAKNDSLANNLANINTPGFKQGITIFKAFAPLVMEKISAEGTKGTSSPQGLGQISTGAAMQTVAVDFTQGQLQTTGNDFDVALRGSGFFEVERPDGQRCYTRDGSFQRDPDGFLVTRNGDKVIGANDLPIQIKTDQMPFDQGLDSNALNTNNLINFDVKPDGTLLHDEQPFNKLKIVDFENKQVLQRVGNSLFVDSGNAGVKEASCSVVQGALEGSNANAIRTMVDNIEGMRTYETLSRIIQKGSDTLQKAVNEVGKV